MNKELSKPGTKNYRKSEECYMSKKKTINKEKL